MTTPAEADEASNDIHAQLMLLMRVDDEASGAYGAGMVR
jgi:hypothetical protein